MMMNRLLRIKILKKLAQTTTTDTTAPATDEAAQTKAVPPAPTFIATNMYPNLTRGYRVNSLPILDRLVGLLNTALHYASGGVVNFQILKNDNFSFDASRAPSRDQQNLINLSKSVYATLLNSGQPFAAPLTGSQIATICDRISASQFFQNLSQIPPTSPLANKLPGNLKSTINDLLTNLKAVNPVQR